jgi:hypothetical protein
MVSGITEQHPFWLIGLDFNGQWKFKLVKELRAYGYYVDANKII